MKQEFYYPSSDGETSIHAVEWVPEQEVKAVLQICHGMVEYIDRYDGFGAWLSEKGWYVTGNDHLGHGKSVLSEENYGFFHEPDHSVAGPEYRGGMAGSVPALHRPCLRL